MMGQLVVVLDDDDAVFDGVVKSLEEAGYLVLPLSTADGLVDELKVTEAAALLLDLQTDTSMVGPDILTQLAHDEALGSLPVLVYSANARQLQELSPRLLARGYGVLQKPLDMGEVLRWLQERVG
jgi:FixJ family two-component response regulator